MAPHSLQGPDPSIAVACFDNFVLQPLLSFYSQNDNQTPEITKLMLCAYIKSSDYKAAAEYILLYQGHLIYHFLTFTQHVYTGMKYNEFELQTLYILFIIFPCMYHHDFFKNMFPYCRVMFGLGTDREMQIFHIQYVNITNLS